MSLQDSLSGEVWKDVVGWEGYYQASDQGRVRSVDRMVSSTRTCDYLCRGKILKQRPNRDGYMEVYLCRNGSGRPWTVHPLVLGAFAGRKPRGMECRHLDGNRVNNKLANLRWGTRKENVGDMLKHGTARGSPPGEEHRCAKLNKDKVLYLRKLRADGRLSRPKVIELAELYGTSTVSIWAAARGATWKHLTQTR